jgi:flagellar motility protein MotE (MotC chaperone)
MKLRVLPLVMASAGLLLVLKAVGLLLTGHYAFEAQVAPTTIVEIAPTYRPSAAARSASNPWASAAAEYDPMITGSAPPKKPKPEAPAAEAKPTAEPPPTDAAKHGEATPGGTAPPMPADAAADLANKNPENLSSAEKALLDRLQARRQELDSRNQELNLRENLLRAAEKRIEDQLGELKAVEDRIAAAEAARKAEEETKLKDLVIMYENMKPKEAAAIFDVMEMKVLVEVAGQMAPKKAGDVIAKMEPAAAERLTVALARKQAALTTTPSAQTLPKIEGQKSN